MVLTAATVAAAYVNLGPFNIVIALAIASLKATLVVLYFMHARYSPKRTQLVIISAVFWLAIMLALTMSDYASRHPEVSVAPHSGARGRRLAQFRLPFQSPGLCRI